MLSDRIQSALSAGDCLAETELFDALKTQTDNLQNVSLVDIRNALFSLHDRFQVCRDGSNRWRTTCQACTVCDDAQPTAHKNSKLLLLPDPYLWQTQAIDAWRASQSRGIIEAVTGSGKTLVGLMAIRDALSWGSKALVIVPTFELADQWFKRLTECALKSVRIGRLGGGYRSSINKNDILIAIVNSARTLEQIEPTSSTDLLVADECHRYATPQNSLALIRSFNHRIGLSATTQRSDRGYDKYLTSFFGSTVYQYSYENARDHNVIAPFTAEFIGVAFSQQEHQRYAEMTDEIGRLTQKFNYKIDRPAKGLEDFIEVLTSASKGNFNHVDPDLEAISKMLLANLATRRRFLESLSGKFETLRKLAAICSSANGTIVFTQSIESAEAAAAVLLQMGVRAIAIHSHTPPALRRQTLERFREKTISTIVAPKILDEGIDVPEANLAIIMTATRSKRQLIQRLGRILRKKNNGSDARLIVMFVENSIEDPRQGAHESIMIDFDKAARLTKLTSSVEFEKIPKPHPFISLA